MFDFIKNNKTVFGIVFLGVFMIFVMLVIMLTVGGKEEISQDDTSVLPDTSSEREFAPGEREAIFGPTDAERWIADEDTGKDAPVFRALTNEPVASAVVFNKFEGGSYFPSVRYVSLNGGFIYETTLATISSQEKITDKAINNIGDVVWSPNAVSLLTRSYSGSLDVINSTLGTFMRGSTTENTLEFQSAPLTYEHRQLTSGVSNAAFSPDGSQIFYLVDAESGSVGYLESVITGTKAVVFESILRNLTVSWNADNSVVIYTNPSSKITGVVWVLNPNSGSTAVAISNELALAAKQNLEGDKLLYSLQEDESGAFSLRVLDLQSGVIQVIPIDTMVEKCTWGPSDNIYCAVPRKSVGSGFLEDWYMGVDNTDDQVWRVDVLNGNIKMILDPLEETGETFDIVNPVVTPDEDYLVFKSQVNNALWSLQLPHIEPKEDVVVENE